MGARSLLLALLAVLAAAAARAGATGPPNIILIFTGTDVTHPTRQQWHDCGRRWPHVAGGPKGRAQGPAALDGRARGYRAGLFRAVGEARARRRARRRRPLTAAELRRRRDKRAEERDQPHCQSGRKCAPDRPTDRPTILPTLCVTTHRDGSATAAAAVPLNGSPLPLHAPARPPALAWRPTGGPLRVETPARGLGQLRTWAAAFSVQRSAPQRSHAHPRRQQRRCRQTGPGPGSTGAPPQLRWVHATGTRRTAPAGPVVRRLHQLLYRLRGAPAPHSPRGAPSTRACATPRRRVDIAAAGVLPESHQLPHRQVPAQPRRRVP